MKKELMNAIQEELTPPVKRKVCDATAELARNLIGMFRHSVWLLYQYFLVSDLAGSSLSCVCVLFLFFGEG